MIPRPTTIDFETFAIEQRPHYPPLPVGVSIKRWGQKARYYAWGHPSGNNCSWGDAYKALVDVWTSGGEGEGLLFQNGKFDIDVATTHMGLSMPRWNMVHDTLFLLFLDDPDQLELGLKPSAERLLGLAPEEQDQVGDWLRKQQPLKFQGLRITEGKKGDHYFGRYIAYAPGDLVGRYANGDVERTEKLFKLLYPKTVERGMLTAYSRECELMPILLEMERQGIRVDLKRLRRDVDRYEKVHDQLTSWIRQTLKAPDLNVDSGDELMDAMIAAGRVDEAQVVRTPKGKISTSKENLLLAVTDKRLLAVHKYRTQLGTCLNTFMGSWLATAELSGGLIFTQWNQVKSPKGDETIGARTGRLSSTPNFQNIPKEFAPIFHHDDPAAKLPKAPFPLPPLPQVRSYVVPWGPDEVLLDRDYSQQELRILGHFEGGALMDAYLADPWLDVHDHTRLMVNQMTGKDFERKPIKNTNFGLIYGMGIGKLAMKSGITVEAAKEVKDAILNVFPGLKEMYHDMKVRAAENRPIRTWGGREYYCEPPKPDPVTGRMMTFDYKQLNRLVQGSAGDCTKQAVINYWRLKDPADRLYLTVHDQLLISTPRRRVVPAMEALRLAMESVVFDVPMLSEGKYSLTSWADLKTYDKAGVIKWHPKK